MRTVPDAAMVRCMTPADRERMGLSPTEESVRRHDARLEKVLLAKCRMLLVRRGVAVIIHIPNAAAKCKGMGDLPDLMFSVTRGTYIPELGKLVAGPRIGIPCAVELKTAKGKLSPGQVETMAALRSDHWVTAIIRDAETFLQFLDDPLAREWPKE